MLLKVLWPLCLLAFSLMFANPSAHALKGDCSTLPNVQDQLSSAEEQWLEAAREGKLESLRALARPGLNIHVTDSYGHSALHLAAHSNTLSVVRELLRLGLSAQAQNMWGETALMLAATRSDVSIAKALINSQSPINLQSCSGNALTYAIGSKNLEMVNLLLDSGANPHLPIRDNLTALMVAIDHNAQEIFDRLMLATPNLEIFTTQGKTALMMAIQKNQLAMVTKLLEAGANADARAQALPTPLALALGNAKLEIVQKLLEYWPNINQTFSWQKINQFNALMVLALRGDELRSILPILIERGANVEGMTPFTSALPGYRPLHLALFAGHQGLASDLLTHTAHPEALTRRDESALWLASARGDTSMALIEKLHESAPENMNRFDLLQRRTPLIWAAMNGRLDQVKFLLSHGAMTDVVDAEEHTAYYYARINGYNDIANELAKVMDDVF